MTTDQKPPACYREPTNRVRFIKAAHRLDCGDGDCRGCKPCPERHCTARPNCSWHVAEGELTCGRCLAATRRDLRWIGDLSALMLTAAIADGLTSEAANLAGPATDAEAWTWRKIAAKQGRAWHITLPCQLDHEHRPRCAHEEDDEHHPLRVTGTWARMLTEDYGHDMPFSASVEWCVSYLDRTLHRIAHDDEQDFPLLGRELRKCRQHLEAVLHNDTRPDRGAPCPECKKAGKFERLVREYAHWCESEDCERLHFLTDADDVWRCPKVRAHWWTQDGYADEVLAGRRATA